ncbi:MAG: cytochrome-c peroxidase [Bacteroidetes bacterium]|nr:cytochrome-c peroxidase [Bacteroidota bacterium]
MLTFVLILCFIVSGCEKDSSNDGVKAVVIIPPGFPSMDFPPDNNFTMARWELGKQLFYEKKLSKNNTISCASCHKQEFAFSDNVALSLGDNNAIGNSNATSLANIGYHPYFTRAGGVPTLEMQILVPIQEHNEFNTNMLDVIDKLKLESHYVQQAQLAYGRDLDAFVITRAISTFERSLISGNSPYDKYLNDSNLHSLSPSELRGLQLFMSPQTNCSSCHSGFNFTNFQFENNGLYLNYADSGRMRLTNLPQDRAKFKVPSLRNVAFTAPYMHDGSFTSLQQVIDHYNSGGQPHVNKSILVQPLNLTTQEKTDLLHFLNTLSDDSFVRNNIFN